MRKSKTAGHLLRNDKIKKSGANFSNTCGFDSIIACLCTFNRDTLSNSSEMQHNIDQLVQYLRMKGLNRKVEALKEFILSNIFKEELKFFKIVDCNNNVSFFVEKMKIESYTVEKECDCNQIKRHIPFIPLTEQESFAKCFENLEEFVKPKMKIKCPKGHVYQININFNETICVSTNYFHKHNQMDLLSNNLVPDEIVVQGYLYRLKCLINFKPPNIDSGIGHYQAYCRSPLGVWEVYDNSNPNILKMSKFVIPHMLIFTKDLNHE